MPLNQSEKTACAEAMLQCFGEDYQNCGRTLKFLSQFTAGQVDLLSTVQTRALTWQPFIDSGLTISEWNVQLSRIYNGTQPG